MGCILAIMECIKEWIPNPETYVDEVVGETFATREGDVGQNDESDTPELLPKHKIFLSHSGFQKPFVEQLCVDLENAGHFPFFDQRPESIPKGEKFKNLILDAAQQCHVAVVVLSEEYLMSKWPMLELATFVEAQRSCNANLRILPIFYKLDECDLKKQQVNKKLKAKWQNFAIEDTRIDLKNWSNALQILSDFNGEKFAKYGGSEVAYRKAIVASVCRLSKPDLQFDVAAMEGRERLCNAIVENLKMIHLGHDIRFMTAGFYGLGGMGKTLICKALCNKFHSEFVGRVCHAEFQNDNDLFQVFQKVLEDLTFVSKGLLRKATTLEQVEYLLSQWLPKQAVFLVIDNIPDVKLFCIEEKLRSIFQHFHPKSKVIFTSRSLKNLQTLLGNFGIEELCHRIPSLQMPEALNIFLRSAMPNRSASSFTSEEMDIVKKCIEQCHFSAKDIRIHSDLDILIFCEAKTYHPTYYHPLALKVLGSYFEEIHSSEPFQWMQNSTILGLLETFHKRSIFDVLGMAFNNLSSIQDKLFFLDIALFAPRQKLSSVKKLCSWLKGIHDLSEENTLFKLNLLQRRALLEHWENNETSRVIVHALYIEFAEYVIQQDDKRWCSYQRRTGTLPKALANNPSSWHLGWCWPELVRIGLLAHEPMIFPTNKVGEWANVRVLCIHNLGLETLDVGPLQQLLSLDLQSNWLKTLICSSNLTELQFIQLDCSKLIEGPHFSRCFNLQELRITHTYNFDHDFLPYPTTALKVLKLSNWHPQLPNVVDIKEYQCLQEIMISGVYSRMYNTDDENQQWIFEIQGLCSLTNLRSLVLNMLPIQGSLDGLECLNSLQHLCVSGCSDLNYLPNMKALTCLRELDVSGCGIEDLQGIEQATQLRTIYCMECLKLRNIPDLRALPLLKEVFTHRSKKLSKQPLVSKACTLFTTFQEKEMLQVEDLLYALGDLPYEEFPFQSTLSANSTPSSSGNLLLHLNKNNPKKSEGHTTLYQTSTTKKLDEGYTSTPRVLKASKTSSSSSHEDSPHSKSYQVFKDVCYDIWRAGSTGGGSSHSSTISHDHQAIWNSCAFPIAQARSHHNTLHAPNCTCDSGEESCS